MKTQLQGTLLARIIYVTGYLTMTGVLTGCDGHRPFGDYSNYDLGQQYAECQTSNLSPGGAQRCRNIEKECKIRRKETGFRC